MDDHDAADLARRLEAVERRLDRLDGHAQAAEGASLEADTSQVFWILDGLKARLGAEAGAVVLAGIVPLPTGERYSWQYGRSSDDLLSASWPELSKTIGALAHPVRLRLLQLVLTGTTSAADLQSADELGTTGQLYHHLRQLVAAGWLTQAARGQYSVPGNRVVPLLVLLLAVERLSSRRTLTKKGTVRCLPRSRSSCHASGFQSWPRSWAC